jgi:hypothetical protein
LLHFLALFLLPSAAFAEFNLSERNNIVCDRVIDDFSASQVGGFPSGWLPKYDKHLKPATEQKLWVVEADKDKKQNVLKGTYGFETMTIIKTLDALKWKLEDYPYLEWEWKAVELPAGANEFDKALNDSAASVYVAWRIRFSFVPAKTLRFAWSTTQAVNQSLRRLQGYDNIVIMESGPENVGKWRRVRVSLKDLIPKFIKLKGSEANPYAIALTTDADQTKSKAAAYYANFKLCRDAKKGEKTNQDDVLAQQNAKTN